MLLIKKVIIVRILQAIVMIKGNRVGGEKGEEE